MIPPATQWITFWQNLPKLLAGFLCLTFIYALWQAIEIGSAHSSFQKSVVQLTTMEATNVRLEKLRRDAELRVRRLDDGALSDSQDGASSSEVRQALEHAARDYGEAARQYLSAACDAASRLKSLGGLVRPFLSQRPSELQCSELTVDLEAGQAASSRDPTFKILAVRLEIEHYGLLASTYLLPVLFGILGALVFALWDMISFPERIDSIHEMGKYALRTFLGAIFGLIIGFINVGSSGVPAVATSPLLLSLVAGYSGSSIISLLDRISRVFDYDSNKERQ